MAFDESWVETDPDGAVIRVSQMDNYVRGLKSQIRQRLEGDPAAPDLTGLLDVGSFASAPKPRKGTARVYVDTEANILAFGATKREDGRLGIASDTGRLLNTATAAVAEILVAIAAKRVTLAYAASIAVNARLGSLFAITVTDANNFTIQAPSNPTDGQVIRVIVRNTTGSTSGTITWTTGAGGFFGSPTTSVGANITQLYRFTYFSDVNRWLTELSGTAFVI